MFQRQRAREERSHGRSGGPLTPSRQTSISVPASLHLCLTKHRAHAPHSLSASLSLRPHSVLRTCHQHGVEAPWKHTQAHVLFPNSAAWLTRWYVLVLRPQPIRQEDTNLPQQVMLKATGHYLWPISAWLPKQTEKQGNDWRTRLLCTHLPLLNLTSAARTPTNTRKITAPKNFPNTQNNINQWISSIFRWVGVSVD